MQRLLCSALILALGCSTTNDVDDEDDDDGHESESESSTSTSGGTSTDEGSSSEATGEGSDTTDATGTDDTGGPVSGCGIEPPWVGQSGRSMTVDGIKRNFVLAIPPDYDASNAYPLIFGMHGFAANGSLSRLYFDLEEPAEGQAIFVYPDGLLNENGERVWDGTPDGVDLRFFDALLEKLESEYCIDRDRIMVIGHSMGGRMTNILGCLRANRIRAIAPIAGRGPDDLECVDDQLAVWIAHGPEDPSVPFEAGKQTRDHWIERNHCWVTGTPVEPEGCFAYDDCDEGYPVQFCTHDETDTASGNHAWPTMAGEATWNFLMSLEPKPR